MNEINVRNETGKRANLPERTKPKLSPHKLRHRERNRVTSDFVEDTPVLHREVHGVTNRETQTHAYESSPMSLSIDTPLTSSVFSAINTTNQTERVMSDDKRTLHIDNKNRHDTDNERSHKNDKSTHGRIFSSDKTNTNLTSNTINYNYYKTNEDDYSKNDNTVNTEDIKDERSVKSELLLAPRELDMNDESYCWSELDRKFTNVRDRAKESDINNTDDRNFNDNIHYNKDNNNVDVSSNKNVGDEEQQAVETQVEIRLQTIVNNNHNNNHEDEINAINSTLVTGCPAKKVEEVKVDTQQSQQESTNVPEMNYNADVTDDIHTSFDSSSHNENDTTEVSEIIITEAVDRSTEEANSNHNNNVNTHKHKKHNGNNTTSANPFTRANKSKFPGAKPVEDDVTSFRIKIFVGLGVIVGIGVTVMLLRTIRKLDSAAAHASQKARGMFRSIKTYYVPYTHSTASSTRKVALTQVDEQREAVTRIREHFIAKKLKTVRY